MKPFLTFFIFIFVLLLLFCFSFRLKRVKQATAFFVLAALPAAAPPAAVVLLLSKYGIHLRIRMLAGHVDMNLDLCDCRICECEDSVEIRIYICGSCPSSFFWVVGKGVRYV